MRLFCYLARSTGIQHDVDFYKPGEYKNFIYQSLKKYSAKCVYGGRSRRDGVKLHVDHIKPRRKYPQLALEFSNFQVLCENCNPGKSNTDEPVWQ
ncbi:HNH endonuclease [Scandinavium tedordense]|uniref:HNH endonuclease n=1 Tax=Scandinavium tedordense TaxID=2926521 RepID=UPI0035AE5E84